MSDHFLDTSGLVKHYHPEVGTPKVDLLWTTRGARLFISRLGVVETVSVFARKVRSGVITVADFGLRRRRRFFADLRQRRPSIVRVLVRHVEEADRLLQQHSLTHSLNTLDAIQLAVAVDLRRRGLLDELVTADRVLKNCVRLSVFDLHFREDLAYWIEQDRKVALRILRLVESVLRDPVAGEGKPEALKGLGAGVWSRRITQEHRLVYLIKKDRIHFLQA